EIETEPEIEQEPEPEQEPETEPEQEPEPEPEIELELEPELERVTEETNEDLLGNDSNKLSNEEELLREYVFPSLDLLNPPVDFQSTTIDDWVLGQAELLNETLDAFNILAQVVGWTVGPAVTQFELQLGRGVKVNKITNLSDDLKLALAAKDIRIEAPIPGKNTVGVEIPNRISRPVMLSEVMASEKFKNSHSPLTVAIGVNLAGDAIVSTLDKMPHGLIAGATGSGKSVFINSILVSLLYKANPSEVKLILIDPKAVELAPYNAIPHLLSPVISEPKAASEALKWAVNEMEERYQKLALAGVRNIQRFNEKAEEHGDYGLKLPYIVIVIDELADLMMVASSDVQDSIVRITQKARAAGIHLLVATQRPSVDVITGTIKNNIPTRIAFMVSSQVDSRTIMDSGGAEKLLGRGDMLFLENGASQPIRIQGTYVEKEIDSIVKHVKEQRKTNYLFEPESLLAKMEAIEGKDELYDEILLFIIEEGQVSASSLQRKFKIGFNRASNIIETLENENLISANKGSKPRDVFITKADYEERYHDTK
ncbi:MAG: DNA translocase FtsK, partial [Carnobacterium sp.]